MDVHSESISKRLYFEFPLHLVCWETHGIAGWIYKLNIAWPRVEDRRGEALEGSLQCDPQARDNARLGTCPDDVRRVNVAKTGIHVVSTSF
jgi:hypothetical protein